MQINEPRCDWIRLTTYEKPTYLLLAEQIKQLFPRDEPRPGGFLQYGGDRYSHAFHGQGEQNGYAHWLVEVTGENAQAALLAFVGVTKVENVKCRRLDIQVTVPLPKEWDIRYHVDTLRECSWPWRRRKVEFYENEGVEGTIYIGSRTSDKFARMYVKFTGDEKIPLVLRYEIENKREVADLMYKALLVGGVDEAGLLRGEWERLPLLETSAWHAIEKTMPKAGTPVILPKTIQDDNKTIRWLIHKVTPTIRRMLNSHEFGYRTYEWLKDFVEYYEQKEGSE